MQDVSNIFSYFNRRPEHLKIFEYTVHNKSFQVYKFILFNPNKLHFWAHKGLQECTLHEEREISAILDGLKHIYEKKMHHKMCQHNLTHKKQKLPLWLCITPWRSKIIFYAVCSLALHFNSSYTSNTYMVSLTQFELNFTVNSLNIDSTVCI